MADTLPISVVIPAYQAEAHIARALADVAAQTRPPAEVIVVDDGSTDGTAEIARRAGATVLWQPNRGVAAARNAGIRAAREPWVALLDADDTWTSDRLAAHWEALALAPAVRLSFSDYAIVRPGGAGEASALAHLAHYRAARPKPLAEGVVRFDRAALERLVVRRNFVSSSTLLLERRWLLDHGLFYDEHLPEDADVLVAEDLEWLLRALRHSDALVVERVFSSYVAHESSRSANRRRQAWGVVRLGELVAAAPERYAEGSAREFARLRSVHERAAAFESFRRGDYAAARNALERALERRFDPASFGLYAATLAAKAGVGRRAIEGARMVRRMLRAEEGGATASLPMPEKESPKAAISVVIPAYNVEQYLAAALASVRAQSLQPAEVIVVDDGSSDGTRALAIAAGVRVVTQDNAGVSAARNAGIAAATQPWIALLDADDTWRPDKLQRQWAARSIEGVRFVASDASLHFEADGRVVDSGHGAHPAYRAARKVRIASDLVRIDRAALSASLPLGHYMPPSTWLVDRALLLANPFDVTLERRSGCQVGEDFEWLLRALRESDALVVEAPLTAYCVRAGGNLSESAGRARAGDVALGRMVGAAPQRYLPGVAENFAGLLPRHVAIAAEAFLRAGDAPSARAVLEQLEPRRRGPRWYALWFAAGAVGSRFGPDLLRGLRSVKRSLAR